jgi:hypothetical protein
MNKKLMRMQCASAIRWAGFAEYVYASNVDTLFEKGFDQISITSEDVFGESTKLLKKTILIRDILANETDPLFSWQFDENGPCPKGCGRSSDGKICEAIKTQGKSEL